MHESIKFDDYLMGSLQMRDVDTDIKKEVSKEGNNSFKNAENPNMI